MGLIWVFGGQRDEEIDDSLGVGATVAVVAEEDDEGGVEMGRVDLGLEIGPEVLELGDVAMGVAYATHQSVFCGLMRLVFHLYMVVRLFLSEGRSRWRLPR